jgi:hypothetical protein
MGEGNENLVYSSPRNFKRSLTYLEILRHGTSGFTSHPKEGVLRIFIALAGFEHATFGSSDKTTNHYTTKATSEEHTVSIFSYEDGSIMFKRNVGICLSLHGVAT